jgi:glycosyltransferase involved in cell wall biosynthesis
MATKITIVTVVRNDAANIEKTILSVLSQNYPSIEYIMIDGGSTDQTIDIINTYADRISKIISEPDHGTFDGMNKAIDLASGEWINFMNSGDRFANDAVVSQIFTTDRSSVDIIYGNSIIELKNGKTRLLKVTNNQVFWKRYINHQSIFTRTELLRNRPFNLKYDLCSDFDFLINMCNQYCKILPLPFPVSVRASGGKSDKSRIRSQLQKAEILIRLKNKNISKFKVACHICLMILKEFLKSILKFLLFRSN